MVKAREQGGLMGEIEILARQCEAVLALLHHLAESADDTLQASAVAAQGLLETDELQQCFKKLLSQLKSRSLDARSLVAEIDGNIKDEELALEFAEIAKATQQLHYDIALTALGKLLDRRGWREA
jgi:two-component system, sensor histidine kinase and response regulator